MIDFIRLNGMAIRLASAQVRETPAPDGSAHRALTLVAIVRGMAAQRDLLDLLAAGAYLVEVPRDEGWESFPATLADHTFSEMSVGSTPVFRHLLTLDEGGAATPGREDVATRARIEAALAALEEIVASGLVDREALLREIGRRLSS